MSTPSVVPQDESVPPLPAGLSTDPAAPAAAGKRRSRAGQLVIVIAVLISALGGSGVLPMNSGHWLLFTLGAVVGLNLHVLAAALVAPFSGLAAVWTSIGAGRRLGGTVLGGRLVVVRLLPILLVSRCLVLVDRPGLRRRLWSGTALSLLAEALTAAALVAAGGPAAWLGWGSAAVTVLIYVSRPRHVTSPFWRLFRLPFGREDQRLAEWLHDPATLAAAKAAAIGRVDLVRGAIGAAAPSDSARRQAMTAVLAIAEGRCADAARTAAALRERSEAPALRREALQLYASAIADGIVAGHWRADDAMPVFSSAMAALRAEAPGAALRGTDLAAVEALFQGRAPQAEKLAALAAAVAPDSLTRARALLTQSAAHAMAGHHAHADTARRKAVALSPTLRLIR